MLDFEEVFGDKKPEVRHDVVKKLIEKMNKFSEKEDFESAKIVLDEIGKRLEPRESYEWHYDIQTLEDINNMLLDNTIRLNVKHYDLSDWLNLLLSLDKRKSELQGGNHVAVIKIRKVVAEEMLCLRLTVPKKERGVGEMPNRAFLDVLHSVHPDLCRKELGRREQVKLWKAIEKGNKEDIQKARKEVSKYSNKGQVI